MEKTQIWAKRNAPNTHFYSLILWPNGMRSTDNMLNLSKIDDKSLKAILMLAAVCKLLARCYRNACNQRIISCDISRRVLLFCVFHLRRLHLMQCYVWHDRSRDISVYRIRREKKTPFCYFIDTRTCRAELHCQKAQIVFFFLLAGFFYFAFFSLRSHSLMFSF